MAASKTTAAIGPTTAGPRVVARPAVGETRAVVVLCYGGKANSQMASRPWHLSAVRLRPFARRIHARSAPEGVATWTVRYRLRGWNDDEASPVADVTWALDEVQRRHGAVPVVLVGHSMGGRAALRAAGHPRVIGVVALAPWLDGGEPVHQLAGRRVLVVHGTADRWTSPAESLRFSERLLSQGVDVHRVELPRRGHFMLRRVALWHGLTVLTALRWLADALSEPSNSLRETNTGHTLTAPMRLRIRA